MPKLRRLDVAYAPNLTDLKGLQNLKRVEYVALFNCTGLKDLHDLDDVDFVQNEITSGVDVYFTDDVKYVFNDFNFGPRIKSIKDTFMIYKSTLKESTRTSEPLGDDVESAYWDCADSGVLGYNRYVFWVNDKVVKDYTA